MSGTWQYGSTVAATGIFLQLLWPAAARGARSVHIDNPSFEVSGGIGGDAIPGWTSSDASMTTLAPPGHAFFDGGQVASITNAGAIVSLSQHIAGLDTGKKYIVSYQVNTSLLAAAGRTSYDSLTFGSTGGTAYSYIGPFSPPSAAGVLSLANIVSGGTVQFDAVTVRAVAPNEVYTAIFDPSFEGSASAAADGTTSRIGGWTSTGTTGVNPSTAGQSPYADNGVVPDGDNVAFLKATPGSPASLSTWTGANALTPGARYELRFRYNAASGSGAFDPALMTVKIGAATIAQNIPVTPAGDGAEYNTFDVYFTAPVARDPWLTISNTAVDPGRSSILLLDDFIVLTPEPGSVGLLMAAGGLVAAQRRCRNRDGRSYR